MTTKLSFISILSILKATFESKLLKAEIEENLFLMSLIGATIQDGGKREREKS